MGITELSDVLEDERRGDSVIVDPSTASEPAKSQSPFYISQRALRLSRPG